MPLVEHRPRGLYLDDCHAPYYRVRWVAIVALLVGALLWLALIFAAVAIWRFLRGEA